jgi:hypothetical protein
MRRSNKFPFDGNGSKNVKKLLKEIEAVLWNDWDPIHVNDCLEAKGEYDSYAGAIFTVAFKTRSTMAIAEHLMSVENASMGFEKRDAKILLPVAEKILKIVEKV